MRFLRFRRDIAGCCLAALVGLLVLGRTGEASAQADSVIASGDSLVSTVPADQAGDPIVVFPDVRQRLGIAVGAVVLLGGMALLVNLMRVRKDREFIEGS